MSDNHVARMKRSGIRGCRVSPGLFASLTLRAALRAFNALRAIVGHTGMHPDYKAMIAVKTITDTPPQNDQQQTHIASISSGVFTNPSSFSRCAIASAPYQYSM
jgi:hypothetical protein